MRQKTLLLLLLGGLVLALVVWLWPASRNYVNFPPSANGPWVAFGDSLTEGFGVSEGRDYPAVLSKRLGIPILNHGHSGDTSADGLARLDETTKLHPRVVLLCLGGNDVLSQVPRAQMLANLTTIIDRFHGEGTFVVLIGIRSASLRDRNEKYFAQLAKEKRVAYLPDILRGIAFKPVYMSDAVHPNEQGYERVAGRIERFLQPYLSQLRNPGP